MARLVIIAVLFSAISRRVDRNYSMSTPNEAIKVGIDLGTTYSCVSAFVRGRLEVIPNEIGARTTPSYVSFTDSKVLVGESAVDNGVFHPRRTFHDCKRLIGKQMSDHAIQEDIKRWRFDVENLESKPRFRIHFRDQDYLLSPTDIGGIILRTLKIAAENYLNQKVVEAVITVPAYFSNSQRSSTIMAGQMAGFIVNQIVNEPTAAAIAYCHDNNVKQKSTLLVFDLGGGTFDVSLVEVDYVAEEHLLYPEVKASSGHGHLGGLDFTVKIRDVFIQEFSQLHPGSIAHHKQKCEIRNDGQAMELLMAEAEKAKRRLSFQDSYRGNIRQLHSGLDFEYTITQAELMEACWPLFQQTIGIMAALLSSINFEPNAVTSVLLVGGSTRMIGIRTLLRNYFNRDIITSLHADEDVARGAALLAASTTSLPDAPNIFLRDITPIPLGIAASIGGILKFSTVIDKYTQVPRMEKVLDKYSRPANHSSVTIKVYEGFDEDPEKNTRIGKFSLDGCTVFDMDVPITVVFDLNSNGVLKVDVVDVTTGAHVDHKMQVGDVEFTTEEVEEHRQLLDYFVSAD